MPYGYTADHPGLLAEVSAAKKGERRFTIDLPALPQGRDLEKAYLVISNAFPNDNLEVFVAEGLCLRVPHVESTGKVCFDGDPGPRAGLSAEERIDITLRNFLLNFVIPWGEQRLDGEFELEAKNYWELNACKQGSKADAVVEVYNLDGKCNEVRTYASDLILPLRWLLASSDTALAEAVKHSLGDRTNQVVRVRVLQMPIQHEFTPHTWPQSRRDIEQLIFSHTAGGNEAILHQFFKSKEPYRVVIFSSQRCDYPYLLPGGPPVLRKVHKGTKPLPADRLVPLPTQRLDPSWTYGRDMHPEVLNRQRKHVVVFGCGALGSPVIDQLARAGVGRISVVDPDLLTAPNIGRHLLGMRSLGNGKAKQVCAEVAVAHPACRLESFAITAQKWMSSRTFDNVDVILDLTGEPDVRHVIHLARMKKRVPLLIGWMEPYVTAAHACMLLRTDDWMNSDEDPLERLQAVTWPADVISKEPACGSEFQAYTAAAAVHAVALVTEASLALIDESIQHSQLKSWVRGNRYLSRHWAGLTLRHWATAAKEHDGLIIERMWESGSLNHETV